MAQCLMLVNNQLEVSSDVLGLAPRVCELEILKVKLGKDSKGHPWQTLPGGALAALKRITGGSSRFTSQLKPNKLDNWTFPEVVGDQFHILVAC